MCRLNPFCFEPSVGFPYFFPSAFVRLYLDIDQWQSTWELQLSEKANGYMRIFPFVHRYSWVSECTTWTTWRSERNIKVTLGARGDLWWMGKL